MCFTAYIWTTEYRVKKTQEYIMYSPCILKTWISRKINVNTQKCTCTSICIYTHVQVYIIPVPHGTSLFFAEFTDLVPLSSYLRSFLLEFCSFFFQPVVFLCSGASEIFFLLVLSVAAGFKEGDNSLNLGNRAFCGIGQQVMKSSSFRSVITLGKPLG